MTRALDRAFGFVVIGLLVTFCAALGTWWWVDRSAQYEQPHWNEAQFEPLGARAATLTVERDTWVVAVNPACSHCMTTLNSLADTLATTRGAPRLLALVVDTAQRPVEAAIRHPRLEGVYWDRNQVWRTRWGHRVYGEILRFDAAGQWIRAG